MAVIGVSLIVASVLWVIVRPPPWLVRFLLAFRGPRPAIDPPKPASGPRKGGSGGGEAGASDEDREGDRSSGPAPAISVTPSVQPGEKAAKDRAAMPPPPLIRPAGVGQETDDQQADKAEKDRAAMPPPPLIRPPSPENKVDTEQTTPKASASQPPAPVPDFSLPPPSAPGPRPTPSFPAANSPQRASFPAANSPQRVSNTLAPTPNRLPSLAPPARPNPLPNRGPPAGSSLAPPPTHSAKPAKPSRKVMLPPGHSPLDWASISGPSADLRNLPPSTPFLRVTPSMLKKQNGRKGSDAWMVLGGRVYNVSPYANYHPGGVGELMRGAGKDGTKLFGEVHPWVNYEGMLQACLVGVYVEEGERNTMEDMD